MFSRDSRNHWSICWRNMCIVWRKDFWKYWSKYFGMYEILQLSLEEQETLRSMELSTRKGLLYISSQQILKMIDYLFSMLKYNGFTSTLITKFCSHRHLIEVVNGDLHLCAIKVNITTQLYLCLFEELYCHGVLYPLHCCIHSYLEEKDNRIPSSFYY